MMRYFIALFFITLHGYALSQRENTLVVNKIFTDPVVLRLEGNTSQTVSIKDLRGKKIILDLFTSSCVVCFKMLPKLDSLQRKFKDHLRFILIGKEDASIRSIYNRFEKKLGLQLDKGFDSAFFNHMRITYVPTYIWIDEKGLVKAVTGVEELREDNIIRFLDNKEIQSKVLTQAVAFDPRQLLLVNGNGGDENDYVSRTVISKWNPTLPFYIPPLLQSSRDGPFFQTLGASLPELYNYAYFGLPHWNSKHNNYGHVFPSPLLEDSLATTGNEKYCYSYFRSGMDTTALSIQWIMQNELKSYFGCEARVVTRLMPCWELVQTKPGSIGKANVSVTSEKVHTPDLNLLVFPYHVLLRNFGDIIHSSRPTLTRQGSIILLIFQQKQS